jgi:superfamily II DNA or RNA helicase
MLRPTKSITLYQQAIGRGTRLADYKENLLLLDFLYQADKKLVCRPAHLIAATNEEADAITEASKSPALPGDVAEQMPMDLQGLASEVQVQREAALKKKLKNTRTGSPRPSARRNSPSVIMTWRRRNMSRR